MLWSVNIIHPTLLCERQRVSGGVKGADATRAAPTGARTGRGEFPGFLTRVCISRPGA